MVLKKFNIFTIRISQFEATNERKVKKMKKLLAVIICMTLALTLAACGASAKNNDAGIYSTGSTEVTQSYNYSTEESLTEDVKLYSDTASADSSQTQTEEKVIKTVVLHVQTKEYTAYINALTASVTSVGGYVETSSTDLGDSSSYNRNATYTVRIPANKLDDFLTKAGENGKITSITEEQQNVTLEYVDLESRISAYKTERDTLTKLLEKAESLENVLAIQERLSEVNYEIESYTAQLRVLENRVSYSTVTMHIWEVERVTEEEPSLWSQIKNRFLDNLDELGDMLRTAVVDIIGGLPIILPVGAIAVVAILIIRKLIKKRRAKRNI